MNTTSAARILLVEDDAPTRELTEDIFRSRGYEVEAVADGEAALELVVADQRFDLLVTDIGLPGMSGLELISRIRGEGINLRILLMSGYEGPETHEREGSTLGATVLVKPFNLRDLLSAVERATNA